MIDVMEKLINLQRLGRFLEKVKSLIDEKYTKPTGGIPKADLADDAKITKANITSAMGGVVALKSQAVPNTGDSTIYGNKTFASGITLGDADLGGKIEPYIIVTSVDVMNSSDGQSTNYDLTGEYEYDCDGKKVYKATPFDEIWEDVPELWLRFNGTELDAVLIPDDMKFFVEDPRFDPDEGDFIVTGVTKDVDGDIIINNTHWSQVKSAANGAVRYDVSQSLQLSDQAKSTARQNINADEKMVTATSQPSGGFKYNAFYNLGVLEGSHTFALATTTSITDECVIQFSTGDTAPSITWFVGVSWYGGSAPTINANKGYRIAVCNGLAICGEF